MAHNSNTLVDFDDYFEADDMSFSDFDFDCFINGGGKKPRKKSTKKPRKKSAKKPAAKKPAKKAPAKKKARCRVPRNVVDATASP